MNESATTLDDNMDTAKLICSACALPGAEIKVHPCSCLFHVSCIPLSYFSKKIIRGGGEYVYHKKELEQEELCPSSALTTGGEHHRGSSSLSSSKNCTISSCSNDDQQHTICAAQSCSFCSSQNNSDDGAINTTPNASFYFIPMDINSFPPLCNSSPTTYAKTTEQNTTITTTATATTEKAIKDKFLMSLEPVFPKNQESSLAKTTNTSPSPSSSVTPQEIIIEEDIQIRNGRWTHQEIKYIDELMTKFHQGTLLLPNGGSLNNFLRSMFLCKGTRLRKKMKNANFCTSFYNMNQVLIGGRRHDQAEWKEGRQQKREEDKGDRGGLDTPLLSLLQHEFLQSLDSEEDRNLLSFSMKRMWMTHFYNYCIQSGFVLNEKNNSIAVAAADWLESIESIEKQVRALNSKNEKKRCFNTVVVAESSAARRENNAPLYHHDHNSNMMSDHFGLRWDHLSVNDNNDFGLPMPPNIVPLEVNETDSIDDCLSVISDVSDQFSGKSTILEHTSFARKRQKGNDMIQSHHQRRGGDCNHHQQIMTFNADDNLDKWTPFIHQISTLIESNKLPFQYFDVWYATSTPSSSVMISGDQSNQKVLLRHVGHSALGDIDSIWNLYHMNQFGEYSSNFAFSPGQGLPGRVISSGMPVWDDSIQNLSSHFFPRVQGARNYGIKKGLGIPIMNSSSDGRIVVAMYSISDVPKDINLLQKCCTHFHLSCPRAKWELILDSNSSTQQKSLQTRDDEEAAIADLLSRHCSIQNQNEQQSFIGLRLLLLKEPSKRESSDTHAIQMIKASFRDYLKSSKEDGQIASLLVQEWNFIKSEQTTISYNTSSPLQSPEMDLDPQLPSLSSLIERKSLNYQWTH